MLGGIQELGASLVAIGVTATFSQMAFAEAIEVGFPLLSDWGGATASAYGVRYESWKGHAGVAKRSLFVLDGSGWVRYSWYTDDALHLPDMSQLMDAIIEVTSSDASVSREDVERS